MTNRATNGHRFVFHSAEVNASERHYIPDEPGINPEESIPVQCNPSRTMPPLFAEHASSNSPQPSSQILPASTPLPSPSSTQSGLLDNDEPPSLVSSSSSLSSMDELNLPRLLNPSNLRTRVHISPPPPLYPNPPAAAPFIVASHGQKEEVVEKRKLRAGDLVYWHHLTRGGEIPGVCEDARARVGRPSAGSRGAIPIRRKGNGVREEEKDMDHSVGVPIEGVVVAGR